VAAIVVSDIRTKNHDSTAKGCGGRPFFKILAAMFCFGDRENNLGRVSFFPFEGFSYPSFCMLLIIT